MSTKTTFKRVALIAVASLGLGVLTSIAPATAAGDYGDFFTDSTPTSTGFEDDTVSITQTSGANNFVVLTTDNTPGVVTISGSKLSVAASVEDATVEADGLSASQTGDSAINYKIATKTPGTITVKFFETVDGVTDTTATEIAEITVIDAASLKASASNSKSIIDAVNDGGAAGDQTATKDDTVVAVGLGAEDEGTIANIKVTIKDGNGTGTVMEGQAVKAIISGAGLVEGASVASDETDGDGKVSFAVSSDGTAGVGTIVISAGKTVIATEKVTFSGAPKTITATQNLKIAGPTTDLGGFGVEDDGTHNGAVTLTVKDKDGNLVPNALDNIGDTDYNIVGTSSDKTIIKKMVGADIESNDDGTYEVIVNSATSTSGKSASLTFTVVDAADDDAVLATSSAVSFAVGGTTIASIVLGFNKQVFAPGEKAKVTLTAKDSDGFAVADDTYQVFADEDAAFAGLSTSFATTGAPFSYEEAAGSGTSFVGGVATSSMFAPLIGGPITVSGTLGTTGTDLKSTIQGTDIEGTANVSSAASETGAQITSLMKKINALTKLIAKIQKKLGVK
jgi:hypothetical protein